MSLYMLLLDIGYGGASAGLVIGALIDLRWIRKVRGQR